METPQTTADNTAAPEISPHVNETQQSATNVNTATPKQKLAAQMMVEGITLRVIAKKLKIRHETITRWKKNPAFQAEYDRLVAEEKKAAEERRKEHIKAREEMRAHMHHDIAYLMHDAIYTVTSQFNNASDYLSDRSKLAFEVLKFLKADQFFTQTKQQFEKQ